MFSKYASKKILKLDNYQKKLSMFCSTDTKPNEFDKDCNKDASDGLSDQINTSSRPSNEKRQFKLVSHLS